MPIGPIILYYLAAFNHDLFHHLEQTKLFATVERGGPASYEGGLIFICSLADGLQTQEKVADALERVWIELPIRYPEGTESHELTTVMGPDGTRWGFNGDSKSHKVTMVTGEVRLEFAFVSDEMSVSGMIKVLGFK